MNGYVVELEPGVWCAPWSGDPGRTLVKSNAKVYPSVRSARGAIRAARRYRPFAKARPVPA